MGGHQIRPNVSSSEQEPKIQQEQRKGSAVEARVKWEESVTESVQGHDQVSSRVSKPTWKRRALK